MKHPTFPLVAGENVSDDFSLHFGEALHPLFVLRVADRLKHDLHRFDVNDLFLCKHRGDWVVHNTKDTLYQGPDWDAALEVAKNESLSRPHLMRGRSWEDIAALLSQARPQLEMEGDKQ